MGVGPRFEATPSWRLAIILLIIVAISYGVEHFFHWIDHKLAGHDRVTRLKHAGLIKSVHKLKDELMLLGFISMAVLFVEDTLAKFCMPADWRDPSDDSFVAANRGKYNDECRVTMYSKSFNSTIQYNGRRRQLLTAAQESAKEALEWAVNNGAPDHVLQTYRDALPTSELASQGAFSSGYAAARRQLGGSGVGVDLSCYGTGQEEFLSAAALHQAHILIFLVAFFHIVYAVMTMLMTLSVVRKLDQYEVWGDDEGETADSLEPPMSGWLAAFARNLGRGTLANPFTYMSLRNFFIIKHRLTADFPFDDYIHLVATDDFQSVVGMQWWMWLLLTCTVLFDGLNIYVGFIWSILPMLISLLVGTKVSKIAGDIAVRSYQLYDENKDGRLSQEEIEKMQTLLDDRTGGMRAPGSTSTEVRAAESSDGTGGEGEGIVRSGSWGELRDANAAEALTDKHFWFGKPRFLSFLIQYIMFQNSMVLSMFVFNFWQVRGDCYLNTTLRLCRVGLGVFVLIHDSLVTLPTYAVVVELGDMYSKKLLNETVSMVADGEVEASHVERGLHSEHNALRVPTPPDVEKPAPDLSDELAGRADMEAGAGEGAMNGADPGTPSRPLPGAMP